MLMGLFQKIKDFFFPPKEICLTVQGYYYLKYVKKIVDGVWKESDYIEHYENALEDFQKKLHFDDGSLASREDAAEVFMDMMAELNVVPCEELVEMGVNSFEQIW